MNFTFAMPVSLLLHHVMSSKEPGAADYMGCGNLARGPGPQKNPYFRHTHSNLNIKVGSLVGGKCAGTGNPLQIGFKNQGVSLIS